MVAVVVVAVGAMAAVVGAMVAVVVAVVAVVALVAVVVGCLDGGAWRQSIVIIKPPKLGLELGIWYRAWLGCGNMTKKIIQISFSGLVGWPCIVCSHVLCHCKKKKTSLNALVKGLVINGPYT